MADSWEEHAEEKPGKSTGLNPNARTFSFNPSATSWAPSFSAPAPPPAAAAAVPPPAPPAKAAAPGSPPRPSSPTKLKAKTASPAAAAATSQSPAKPAAAAAATSPKPAAAAVATSPKPAAAPVTSPKPKSVPSVDEATKKLETTTLDDAEGDLAAEEEVEDVEVEEEDPREHLNLVFIGHVDAGKSTLSGSILYSTGAVDKRTIERFEREAKQLNRESWFLAFIMDTNEEERAKGKTVEVGRAHLETENKRYTIMDAPGHKNYVPNMISGAAQADVGVLVISARRGEFETGFERGGQTREHAMLAKTLGVNKLIVVINKMDEKTVAWDQGRYDECQKKLTPFLKSCGYAVKRDVIFLPISALGGQNIKDRLPKSVCTWYSGPSLLEVLDQITIQGRDPNAPVRVPILDRYQDRGVCAMGKVEAGIAVAGKKLLVMPLGTTVTVSQILINDKPVKTAKVGENVVFRLAGCNLDDIQKGYVLCDPDKPCPAVSHFKALLFLVELLEHRPIFSAGYKAVIHAHTAADECVITKLISETVKDKKTGEEKIKKNPTFVKQGSWITCRIKVSQKICIEKFEEMRQLGRFTLRDEGRTLAIGKILDVYDKK